MKNSVSSDRQFFDELTVSKSFENVRTEFGALLAPRLVWWVIPAAGKPVVLAWDEAALAFARRHRLPGRTISQIRKYRLSLKGFPLKLSKRERCFILPLGSGSRFFGWLGLQGFDRGTLDGHKRLLDLLTTRVALAIQLMQKNEEINRLSASIRPRAIALSTVHTVHRIINSTLNLDELVSRLAHLTAQVLRAGRCAIYLVESSKSRGGVSKNFSAPVSQPKAILCKARVGYPKKWHAADRIPLGSGLEGRVAKTAKIVLRKDKILVPLIDEDLIGVMHVSQRKDKKEFTHFDQEILTTLAEEAVIAIKNAQLYEEQKKVTLGTIQSLAVILGTRVENVVAPETFLKLALKIAEELKLSEDQTQALHYATLLKDTAKIGIPDEILKKPTKLTGQEYRQLREHPMKGARIVQSFESLRSVVPIVLYSREKFDGTGYPKGLKGEKIPMGARILALLNAFEAIIIGRPYRDRSSFEEALEEIAKNSGTQFDPKVVDAFLRAATKDGLPKLFQKALTSKRASGR